MIGKSQVVRNIARVATGTFAGQIILVAATPVLTRLYAPKEFGELALFSSYYGILVGLFTLKLELSVILPSNDGEALGLMRLTLLVSLASSMLLLLALSTAAATGLLIFPFFYYLLPISTFIGAVYSLLQQWCSRKRDYKPFAKSVVVNASANVFVCIALSLFAFESEAELVLGYFAGMACAALYLWQHKSKELRAIRCSVHPSATKLLEQYRHFPLYVLPNALLSVLSYQLLPPLIGLWFDVDTVGFYAIANRFLVLPSALLGNAVAEIFRAELVSRLNRGENTQKFFLRTLTHLTLVAAPIFLTLFVVSPQIFEILLGNNFSAAGVYARYLCLGVASSFVAQPFSYVFIATGKVKAGLALQLGASSAPLLGFAIGSVKQDIATALLASAALTFAASLVLIYFAARCVPGPSGRSSS
jgi:O-antigen/teichoic acid export membrane protein